MGGQTGRGSYALRVVRVLIIIIIVWLAPIQYVAPLAANNIQSGLSSASSMASSTLRLWCDRSFFIVAIQEVWGRPAGLFQSLWITAVRGKVCFNHFWFSLIVTSHSLSCVNLWRHQGGVRIGTLKVCIFWLSHTAKTDKHKRNGKKTWFHDLLIRRIRCHRLSHVDSFCETFKCIFRQLWSKWWLQCLQAAVHRMPITKSMHHIKNSKSNELGLEMASVALHLYSTTECMFMENLS